MPLPSACSVYLRHEYTHRHNAALRILYFRIRNHYGVEEEALDTYILIEIDCKRE